MVNACVNYWKSVKNYFEFLDFNVNVVKLWFHQVSININFHEFLVRKSTMKCPLTN